MQYLGSKTRIADQIASIVNEFRRPGQVVWDAFCGGLSVSTALNEDGPVYSTDVNPALISLYLAVQAGWSPPAEVSRETWESAKSLPDTDPMKAFCGFGCSFGGKWFAGYAGARRLSKTSTHHGGSSNPQLSSRRSLLRDVEGCMTFACVDFLTVEPGPIEYLIYCDPPYEGTTGYDGAPDFDHLIFQERIVEWSKYTDVFVSGYDFPLGTCIWSKSVALQVSGGSTEPRVERLYQVSSVSESERYRRPPIYLAL